MFTNKRIQLFCIPRYYYKICLTCLIILLACFSNSLQMNECYYNLFMRPANQFPSIETADNKVIAFYCYERARCRNEIWCNPRFSVSEEYSLNFCLRNGVWPKHFKCPVCKSGSVLIYSQ